MSADDAGRWVAYVILHAGEGERGERYVYKPTLTHQYDTPQDIAEWAAAEHHDREIERHGGVASDYSGISNVIEVVSPSGECSRWHVQCKVKLEYRAERGVLE